MSNSASFKRWRDEAEKHARAGDYAWMAGLVEGARVLEIGCGAGFGTAALAALPARRVLVLEREAEVLAAAQTHLAEAGLATNCEWMAGDVIALSDEALGRIRAFAPDWIVCWMMGVPDEALDKALPHPRAVQQALQQTHRALGELAAKLASVQVVHLVDRTAFPWKIKDTARETLVMVHSATSFAGSPFTCAKADAIYRKLDPITWPQGVARGAAGLAGVVPVLGSLVARRGAQTTTGDS
jgi:predicted RNA methylase